MTIALALCIGVLFGSAVYMLLGRSLAKLLIGIALLGHATNLLVFVAGGNHHPGKPPILPTAGEAPIAPALFADPLPQAMVLTAIVISFGFLAFVFTLLGKNAAHLPSDDIERIRNTEGLE